MRFGWLTLALSPSPEEDAARIDQQIAQICFAERLGFGDVWLTEHYFTGESVYNDALLFAAAVAMRTERIRIGFAVVQLPFHHPVQLAVQLALLDNLSKGRIDVGVGKGTIYNEYEFIGHGLRSDDSRERMEEAIEIIERLWQGGPVTHSGAYFQVQVPELRPRPVQRKPPLWRSVISPSSFSECGRLGLPILTARLPVARIKERWATYEAGLQTGGHDAATRSRLLEQSALWRNVYVAETDAQAEDELSALLSRTRAHMMHVRGEYNPPGFTIDPAMLNPWADPATADAEAVEYVLATGSLYGSPARVRDQVAELRDAGVRHLLCQTGFGDISHEQNLASMRRFGEEVMPAFRLVDNEEARSGFGRRAVRLGTVRDLIAGSGRQGHFAAVLELGVQHALQHVEDMALRAPVIGQIAGRILDDPHPYVAELTSAPERGAGFAGMHGFRHASPSRSCRTECRSSPSGLLRVQSRASPRAGGCRRRITSASSAHNGNIKAPYIRKLSLVPNRSATAPITGGIRIELSRCPVCRSPMTAPCWCRPTARACTDMMTGWITPSNQPRAS